MTKGGAAAALVYQWSARSRYFTALPTAFLPGCVVISQRAFSSLSVRGQQALRAAAAKFMARFEDVSRTLEEQLVGGLFEKQGLKRVPVTDRFRAEFYDAARRTRERLAGKGVPPGILEETLKWLADHRAETLASGRPAK